MRTALVVTSLFMGCFLAQSGDEQSAATNIGNNVDTNNYKVDYDTDFQRMLDSWPKGAVTNGLACALQLFRPSGGRDLLPLCSVNVVNTTTNWVKGYLNVPLQGLIYMELFDSQGKQVKKTTKGKEYVLWTDKQIEDWINGRPRELGFSIPPLLCNQANGSISFPEEFALTQPGEYSFHLRMRLVQNKKDASGRLFLQTTWLPEVIAKVQIRPEDIPPPDLPSNAQTNSLNK
jgi:hypothetical protein